MADAGVTLKFFGDSSSADASLSRLEQKMQSLENAQRGASTRARASASQDQSAMSSMWDQATTGATGYLTKMFAISKAVELVGSAIGAITEKNTAWSDSIGDIGKKMDDMRAKLGIQMGGVGDKVAGAALERSTDIAMSIPSTGSSIAAGDISRKLSSAGFDKELLKSGVLDEQAHRLNILTGNVGEGADPLAGADMLIQGLKGLAPGTQITPEIASQIVTELGNAFQATTAEKPQLVQYAKKAGLLQALGGQRREGLAAFAMAQETLGGEETATGLKNLALGFNTIKEGSAQAKIVENLGLKPEELHMDKTGGMLASAKFLKERMTLKRLDKPSQDIAMTELFGKEGLAVADFVMSHHGEIGQLAEGLGDEQATEKVRRGFIKSDLSVRNRQQLEGEKLRGREAERAGFTFEDIERSSRIAFDKRRAEAGGDIITRNRIGIEEVASSKIVSTAKAAGVSPEAMIGSLPSDVTLELRRVAGFIEAQNRMMEQDRARVHRNGGVETGGMSGVMGSY